MPVSIACWNSGSFTPSDAASVASVLRNESPECYPLLSSIGHGSTSHQGLLCSFCKSICASHDSCKKFPKASVFQRIRFCTSLKPAALDHFSVLPVSAHHTTNVVRWQRTWLGAMTSSNSAHSRKQSMTVGHHGSLQKIDQNELRLEKNFNQIAAERSSRSHM